MLKIHSIIARIIVILIVAYACSLATSQAQSTKLTGQVIDSTTTPLVAATVVLLQKRDSVMASFAITDGEGNFVLNGIKPGNYYLQITYVGYGNFRQSLELEGNAPAKNLGVIFLSPNNTMLEQVIVKAEHVPIIIKKDTIEYNADAFKVKPNAAVEDLLKRLPGIDVDRDGSIKAQGEDVQNVLVDGKEFFGQDPKIATQNLPADVVDKVQVYDKKSEMAEFSGIEDGEEEKTINLSLKEDKKQGYFGNVKAGFGADDFNDLFENERYQGKLSINRFDNRLQLSVLGMANNINDQGFSFGDYMNFMGGMGNFMTGGGGGMKLSLNSGDAGIPLGYNNAPGITKTAAGGLNFNYDFSDNIEWQSSYFVNHINNNTDQFTTSQNIAGEKSFTTLENTKRDNVSLNHNISSRLKYNLDSTTQFSWINRLSFNTTNANSVTSLQTFDFNNNAENESQNNYFDDGDRYSWVSDLTLRKRLSKPGRILTGNFNLNFGDVNTLANIDNIFTVLPNGTPGFEQRVLQDQESGEDQSQYGIRFSYTEPVARKTYLSLNASRRNYQNARVRDYFDIDPTNPSSRTKNLLLSNHYQRTYTYDQIGGSLKINRKHVNLSGGLDFQHSVLDGEIISENTQLNKSFNFLLPKFYLDYEFGSSKNLNFFYRTRIQEPSLEQLQPLVNNTNPLYLYQGNPELRPEYTHDANVHLMIFDQFSFTSFFANLNSRYTLNRIVNQTSVDELFRQIVKPINVDHDWNTNLYASFSRPIRFIKSKISVDATINYNKGILFVNNLKNNTDRWTNNYTITLENRKKDHIDIALGASLGTSNVKYSVSDQFNEKYFDQTYFVDLNLYLPNAWTIESSLDYTRFSQESFGEQDDLAIWQATLSKGIMKDERATFEITVFDILNQNKGINRANSLNYIQEVRTNVLGRYVMLSFNYKLSQFGGGMDMMKIEHKKR